MSGGSPLKTRRSDIALGIAGLVLLLGIFFYFSSQSQQVLRKSPAGFDGLSIWLSNGEQDVRNFTGGWSMEADSVGLRILPIFDTQLDSKRLRPSSKDELLFQSDEYDLTRNVVASKIEVGPTLLVLPKWRSGMRLTGLAHPALLLPPDAPTNLMRHIFADPSFKVSVIPKPFSDFSADAGDAQKTVRLYVAQVMQSKNCEPLIGTQSEMVLGLCKSKDAHGGEVLVLSDPDLINNHGLRLGDNAQIMRALLLERAAGKLIMIDYSTRRWLRETVQEALPERRWRDLLQFFAYPFSVLWGSFACLMALVLWRAGFRYGPLEREKGGLAASKLIANKARARLLRLTGKDSAMLRDYVATRMESIAVQNLGPAPARVPGAALRFVSRKRPDLAPKLKAVLGRIEDLPPDLSAQAAIGHVDELELILERLEHDT